MKKIIAFLLTIVFCLLMSGCTEELYKKLLIKGFGIDKDGNGFSITVRYASMDKAKGEEQCVVKGETVYEALDSLSFVTGKEQMYASAVFIIFGREVAEAGLDHALDFFIRYFKTRPSINLYVAENTAAEILNTKKDDKLILTDSIRDCTENKQNKGKTVSATAVDFMNKVSSTGTSAVLPVMKKVGQELSCKTSAVFDHYSLGILLNEEETQGYLAAKGKLQKSSLVVADNKGQKITVDIEKTTAKIHHAIKGGKPSFTVDIGVEAVLASLPLGDDQTGYEEIEQLVSEKIKSYVNQMMTASLRAKSDILSLGYTLFLKETKYWKKEEPSWADNLDKITTKVEVKTAMAKTGEEDRPPG